MIEKAIIRAYDVMHKRNWDTIYWAIDLHGTCLISSYDNDKIEFINPQAEMTLKELSKYPETKIILWSCLHAPEWERVLAFFERHGIKVAAVNANPFEQSNGYADFSSKFYFSVLLDDKAGFDPDTDWAVVLNNVMWARQKYELNQSTGIV